MSESLKSERVARQEAEKELNEWRSLNPDIDISSISKKSDGIDK